MKLVPGDHQYAFPLFSVVICWNGSDTFCPTQFMSANSVRDWKLGIITRHLTEALNVFEEVEGDLQTSDEKNLSEAFLDLRDTVNLTSQQLGNRLRGQGQNIPPVTYGAKKGTTSEVTYPVPPGYVPEPFIRESVAASTLDPLITEQNIVVETGRLLRAPTEYTLETIFNFKPQTAHYITEDFFLPMELVMDTPLPSSQMSSVDKLSQIQQDVSQPISQPMILPSMHPGFLPPPPPGYPFMQPFTQDPFIQGVPPMPFTQGTPQMPFTQPPHMPFTQPPHMPFTQNVPDTQESQTITSIPETQQQQQEKPKEVASTSSNPVPLIPEIIIQDDTPVRETYKHPPPLPPRQTSQRAPPSAAAGSASSATSAPLAPIFSTPAAPQSTPTPISGRKYQCIHCQYSTDRKQDFDNHQNMHTGHRFKCGDSKCTKDFASKKNRDFHFKNIHLGIKRCICSVDKCNFQCDDYGIMAVHEFDEHGIGQEARCSVCDKKFGNFRVYQRHIKTCQQEKDKKCEICNKAYKATERLVQHIDSAHKGQPKLICEQCGGVFCSPESLRVHKDKQHKS